MELRSECRMRCHLSIIFIAEAEAVHNAIAATKNLLDRDQPIRFIRDGRESAHYAVRDETSPIPMSQSSKKAILLMKFHDIVHPNLDLFSNTLAVP